LDEKYKLGEINPNLKSIEFFKIKDAFSTFQEISMFLGNSLIVQNKQSEISDKDKIGKHGYDKWSFRKEPNLK
jgi:hypothetical protein